MKKIILSIMMMALLSSVVFGASCAIGGSGNYDFGDVKIGKTYTSVRMYVQPFESDCLRDGYNPTNCPYEVGVEMRYPKEYVSLIGIEDSFVDKSWSNHYFNVSITVPRDIGRGLHTFQVCGVAVNSTTHLCESGICFRVGACNNVRFNVTNGRR